MAKKYLLSCLTLIVLNIVSFVYQWAVQGILEFKYIFFSIVVLITFLASYLYNSYKTVSKKYLIGLSFVLVVLVVLLVVSLAYDGFDIFYILVMMIVTISIIFIVITSIDYK